MEPGESKEDFTKATVRKRVNKILNKIAIEEDTFVYQIIEDMAKEKYPQYFRERKQMTV